MVKKKKSKGFVIGKESIVGIRKIINLSGSHYICLPKEWVEKHGLKEGSEVSIIANSTLTIIPPKKAE